MLGKLSSRYESNGDPGSVSDGWGDAGGVSYGCYQLATNVGSVDSFMRWAHGNPLVEGLSQYSPGSDEFSAEWKRVAEENPEEFEALQHGYISYAYYEPSIELLRQAGYNIENHSEIMKDVVWSRAVQYGTGYIVEMFEDAVKSIGYPSLSYVDAVNFDKAMITAIYMDVCSSEEWTSGSPALRQGLYNRFANECQDALGLLA